jgi:hypothetical protein
MTTGLGDMSSQPVEDTPDAMAEPTDTHGHDHGGRAAKKTCSHRS